MRASTLSSLLKTEHHLEPGADPDISEVTNDSRRVAARSLYAALEGQHVDGHQFIGEAVARGAVAVICSSLPDDFGGHVAVFQTPTPRLLLSEAAHHIYGRPSEILTVIGVTGTDGKTTTSAFIHQMLTRLGYRTGLLSSALIDYGAGIEANTLHQSTPEAPEVHRALKNMVDAGVTHAVVESTSHGLSTKTCRLAHVHYSAAVLTNMSPEHLEFHQTFEQYRHDKANLFRAVDCGCYANAGPVAVRDGLDSAPCLEPSGDRVLVLNADDPVAPYFRQEVRTQTLSFSLEQNADYTAVVEVHADRSQIVLSTPHGTVSTTLNVPGEFNVANLLATVAVIENLTGVSLERIGEAASAIQSVNGRMMVVQREPFPVIVDFAHTPGAFSRVLPFFRTNTSGKLIVVFGSAGERDVGKRSLQGSLADRYADLVYLADEDPRNEDRFEILRQIAAGFTRLRLGTDVHLIPDRREAIKSALASARAGDSVLLLGKGHETSIIGPSGPEPWNEFEVSTELLEAMRTNGRA